MHIVQSDKDSETDKGYYKTESRACTNKISKLCRKGLFTVKILRLAYGQHPDVQQSPQRKVKEGKGVYGLKQQGSLGDE